MTSILNSVAANTALLNLENTVANLTNIQGQISTGLKIQSAADNAAYFSISTVLQSDSATLSTVSDTLNLGSSSLGVSTTAMSQIQTTLQDIKKQLAAATVSGVDRTKIQAQISQDQLQLQNISQSANFNGQNFLSVDSGTTGYNATKAFISSYSRDQSGAISVGFINLDTTQTALFDSNAPASYDAAGNYTGGIGTALSQSSSIEPAGVIAGTPDAGGNTIDYALSTSNGQLNLTTYTLDTSDPTKTKYFSNTISLGAYSGAAPTITSVTAGADAALSAGDTMGGVATVGATAPAYNPATGTLTFSVADNSSSTAGKVQYDQIVIAGFTPSQGGGVLDKQDTSTTGSYTDAKGVTTTTTGGTGVSIFNMNIASLSDSASDMAKLNALEKQVDAAISNVTAAQSAVGTAQARITAQTSFVASLQTSINNGVGSIVDADMNLASTKLQALQVQQQLGIQSLSIANQSSQMILKLFG